MVTTGTNSHTCNCCMSKQSLPYTVDSEFFTRIQLSRKSLKDILATSEIREWGIIYLHLVISPFHEGLIFTKLCICEVSRE